MLEEQEVPYFVTPEAEALLRQARVDPRVLIRRYLRGDLGAPTRSIRLMNAQIAEGAGQVGRYELGTHGALVLRRRRSGVVCVMDAASVLPFLEGFD